MITFFSSTFSVSAFFSHALLLMLAVVGFRAFFSRPLPTREEDANSRKRSLPSPFETEGILSKSASIAVSVPPTRARVSRRRDNKDVFSNSVRLILACLDRSGNRLANSRPKYGAVTQWLECCVVSAGVRGSNPLSIAMGEVVQKSRTLVCEANDAGANPVLSPKLGVAQQ